MFPEAAEPGEACRMCRRAGSGGLLKYRSFDSWSETRLTESCPKLGQDSVGGFGEGAVQGAAAGAAVAAAAEALGDLGYVDLAFAADAEAELIGGGELAEEDRGLDAGDADEVVDDAFAVFGVGAGLIHVVDW